MPRGGPIKRFSDAERKQVEAAIRKIKRRDPDIRAVALHAAVMERTGITISEPTVSKYARLMNEANGEEQLVEAEAQPPVISVTPAGENEVEVYICGRFSAPVGYSVARVAAEQLSQAAEIERAAAGWLGDA